MDHVTPTEPVVTTEPKDDRKPWQELGYEKIDAAAAETTLLGSGTDNGIYS